MIEELQGIKRAQRRLEEQRSREQLGQNESPQEDPCTNQVGGVGLQAGRGEKLPTLETIDPISFRQGFLAQMTASYRATDAIYTRAQTELDQRRLDAQKKSVTEFRSMLDEWEKQVAALDDPNQRKVMEEALMGCRRSLLFSNAAEVNHSSEMLNQHEVQYRAAENARALVCPKEGTVTLPLTAEKARVDWKDFINTGDVHSYRLLDDSKSHFVVFETIASRYGTRDFG